MQNQQEKETTRGASFWRVVVGGTQHYYRRSEPIAAYRFAREQSIYSDTPIVLELVSTHWAKNLVQLLEDVLCEKQPLFHRIKHVRYFENGELLKRTLEE